jgi:hypothetical protein
MIGGIAVTNKRYAVLGLAGALATFGAASIAMPAGATAATPAGGDKAEVFTAAAACVGRNAVSTHEVFVDGKSVGWGLNKTMIQGGSTVKVTFTVAAGCDPTTFGLAIYSELFNNADPTYEEVNTETYATSKTITVNPGQQGSLEITLPTINNCHYQVDFFTGAVITKFGPTGQNYYGSPEDRLIAADHIAKPNCVEVVDTSTTRGPTTSSSTTSSTTSSSTTTTAQVGNQEVTTTSAPRVAPNETTTRTSDIPAQVEAEELSNGTTSTTAGPQVLAEELARTGSNTVGLVSLAGAFALAGGVLATSGSALRRRRNANSGQ